MLASGGESLSRSQSFQGGLPDIYKEENPLARMLTTAHGVRIVKYIICTYVCTFTVV